MTLLVGLDLGTTTVKALLCDTTGQVIATAVRPYELVRPRPGWVEQDLDEVWQAIVETVRQVVAHKAPGQQVAAISFSVASGTTVLVGADGRPLGRALSWMDTRAEPEIHDLLPGLDLAEVYRIAGWPFTGMFTLGHLAWLHRYDRERLDAARRICLPNDFILHRLSGRYLMDPSNAVTTALYDQLNERWHKPYLAAVGVTEDLFSPLGPSGEVLGPLTPEAAHILGLSTDTLVVNGAHDQYCAALGAGVLYPGDAVLSCGTAWVLFFPLADRNMALDLNMLVGPHLVPGIWGAMVDLYSFGLTPEWYLSQLLAGIGGKALPAKTLYQVFNEGAAAASPGANGVIFIPLGSGQTPYGAMVRLLPHHTHGDISRALMEGLAFEVRYQFERLRRSGLSMSALKAVGGAMESPIWPQIVADVVGLPITLLSGQSTAAYGAAILAGVGAGLFADLASGAAAMGVRGRTLEPDESHARRYNDLYGEYQRAVQAMMSLARGDGH